MIVPETMDIPWPRPVPPCELHTVVDLLMRAQPSEGREQLKLDGLRALLKSRFITSVGLGSSTTKYAEFLASCDAGTISRKLMSLKTQRRDLPYIMPTGELRGIGLT